MTYQVAFASSQVVHGSFDSYALGRRPPMAAVTRQTIEQRIRRMTPVAAPEDERVQIGALSKALQAMLEAQRPRAPRCQVVGPSGRKIPVPESVFYVIERVAELLARGDAITVVPVGKEITTQQAAVLLNVSRQYLVRLLDENRIPFRKTGKHRRLRTEDVLAFMDKRDKDRAAGLRELSQLTQDLGGYDAERKNRKP